MTTDSWDLWVISAADHRQAGIFKNRIRVLSEDGKLPEDFRCKVIPDPGGKRAGSGGSTLHIYNELQSIYGQELLKMKVIVLHSGGMSKRLPSCSEKGKLFSYVKSKTGYTTLLSEIIKNYSKVSNKFKAGMLVAPGDMIINMEFDGKVSADKPVGFSIETDIDEGTKHGVYITKGTKVIAFLHKEKRQVLEKFADAGKNVDMDSGVIYFPYGVLDLIMTIEDIMSEPLNLYNDFLMPMATLTERSYYIDSPTDSGDDVSIKILRDKMFSAIKDINLQCYKLSQKKSGHTGTTVRYIDSLSGGIKPAIINSYAVDITSGENSVVEDSVLSGKVKVGSSCLVSGVLSFHDFSLDDGWCLVQVPVKYKDELGFVTKLYPANVNPKIDTDYDWNKKIFTFHKNREQSLLQALRKGGETKLSFKECFKLVDSKTLLWQQDIAVGLTAYARDGVGHKKIKDILGDLEYHMPRIYLELFYKGLKLYHEKIYSSVKYSLTKNMVFEINCDTRSIHDTVMVKSAVRVNIAGGSTDTPPYCYENGGSVINFAVLPDGKYPIKVIIKKSDSGKLELCNSDTCNSIAISEIDELDIFDFPEDLALLKWAAIATGVVGEGYIKGLSIQTHSDLPMGSGLGTSSILVNAILYGIYRCFGVEFDENMIINKTLQIEQLMGSGGGWQDQAGVVYPGFKRTTSKKGIPQQYTVKKYEISEVFAKYLKEHMLLVYTGKRRKASNVLRKVIEGYLSKDDERRSKLEIIEKMPDKTEKAILSESPELFGRQLTSRIVALGAMDQGIITRDIKSITEKLQDFVYGYTICGAGGGGFVVALLKEQYSASDIEYLFSGKNNSMVLRCICTDIPIITTTE